MIHFIVQTVTWFPELLLKKLDLFRMATKHQQDGEKKSWKLLCAIRRVQTGSVVFEITPRRRLLLVKDGPARYLVKPPQRYLRALTHLFGGFCECFHIYSCNLQQVIYFIVWGLHRKYWSVLLHGSSIFVLWSHLYGTCWQPFVRLKKTPEMEYFYGLCCQSHIIPNPHPSL